METLLVPAALRQQWNVSGRLSDLPVVPEWSINGTNAENGRRFRFKRNSIGVWVLLFLVFFAFLTWLLKEEYWRDVK